MRHFVRKSRPQSGIGWLWTLAVFFSIYVGGFYTIIFRHASDSLGDDLQGNIMAETSEWRNFTEICYAGYCGPWIEEYFFSSFNTMHAKERRAIQRVYLPIYWTSCHLFCSSEQKQRLEEYVTALDRRTSYFTVIQVAQGIHHVLLKIKLPDDLNILFFTAGGINKGMMAHNIPIPLVKGPLQPRNLDKKYLLTFVGSLDTHPVRQRLNTMYNTTYSFEQTDDWQEMMEQSKFSLCPRGYGPTSFRIFESILLGSIPVYVWEGEYLLPFSDMLDWDTFSIRIHSSEIETLSERIMQRDYEAMTTALRQVREYFTLAHTSIYIKHTLSSPAAIAAAVDAGGAVRHLWDQSLDDDDDDDIQL